MRHVDVSPSAFMQAVRLDAKRLRVDLFFQSSLRHYLPEHALGTWEAGGRRHVRDVAGVEPEDFLTITRRWHRTADPQNSRELPARAGGLPGDDRRADASAGHDRKGSNHPDQRARVVVFIIADSLNDECATSRQTRVAGEKLSPRVCQRSGPES